AILCARSQYFRAMLCGSWMESSCQCITIQGLGPDEMEVLLHFMYGAIMDLPPGSNVSQVVMAADMLGLEGLKDVAEMVLTRDYCRFFPKKHCRTPAAAPSVPLVDTDMNAGSWTGCILCSVLMIARFDFQTTEQLVQFSPIYVRFGYP
ncbi:AP2-interacting clathrin-endocytosis protein isoform X1, partial [Tachysurus ichikawai]